MREIRLQPSPSQQARLAAAQMGACFQCGRRCKGGLTSDYCSGGGFGLRDLLSVLRGLLRWK
jgi:hypothetical protein